MIRILFLSLACFLLAVPALPAAAREAGIAAIVNHDAISMTDLNDRIRLIMASSGLPDTPEIRSKLTSQVIDSLIEEQLMIQEATDRNISISPEEVKQGFAQLATQNKVSPEQFEGMIRGSGINIGTMQRQIRAQRRACVRDGAP